MCNKFVDISPIDMDRTCSYLRMEEYPVENCKETVFAKIVNRDGKLYQIRVYTSLLANGGKCRESGKDAIRVVVFGKRNGKTKIVSSSKRINRVGGWQDRLTARVNDWASMLGVACSCCDGTMMKRKGKNGTFMGCNNYPECKHTTEADGQPSSPNKKPANAPGVVCTCDKCGSGMVKRKGKWGVFIGCTAFPKCRETKKLSALTA